MPVKKPPAPKPRDLIREAFYALERAADNSIEASGLLRAAVKAAEESERQHRRAGRGLSSAPRLSVADSARYFAVKWTAEPIHGAKLLTAREAAALRTDALAGRALRETLESQGRWTPELAAAASAVAALDYAEIVWGLK